MAFPWFGDFGVCSCFLTGQVWNLLILIFGFWWVRCLMFVSRVVVCGHGIRQIFS